MVEKFRGVLPDKSIWYRLTRNEALALVNYKPDILAQLPPDKTLSEIDSIDIQAFSGKTKDIEELLANAGLRIATLYD